MIQSAITQLIGIIPTWVTTIMLFIGAGMILWFVVWKWARTRDKGTGMSGFPIWTTIVGAALVSPVLILPPVGSILDALINLVLTLINLVVPA